MDADNRVLCVVHGPDFTVRIIFGRALRHLLHLARHGAVRAMMGHD